MATPQSLDLTKKVEAVGLNLQKHGITNVPKCAVKAALDISGSMSGLYSNGSVQKAFEQVLAFGMKFDDNGEVDMYAFNTRCFGLEVATERDYKNYIRENIQKKFNINEGTRYSPTFKQIVEDARPKKQGLLGSAPPMPPTVVLFFTDGANEGSDEGAADRVIREASQQNLPVYFHLIGVGGDSFRQCRKLAEDYDNCGFVQIRSVGLSDDEMYKAMITQEFTDFLRKHGAS